MKKFLVSLALCLLASPVLGQAHSHNQRFLCGDRASSSGPLQLYNSATREWCPGATINDAGADVDVCIEGDTDTALLCTDAGNERIGISTATPATIFHVDNGSTTTTPLVEIEQTSTGDSALQFSIAGDSFAMGVDNTTDNFAISYAASAGGAVLGVANKLVITPAGIVSHPSNIGAAPAATCGVGAIFIDTDETDDTNCTTTADNSLCLCVAANTWVALENN